METPPTSERPAPRRRIPLIALGAVFALVAGLGIAWAVLGSGPGTAPIPMPSGSLEIEASGLEDVKADPAKPLRCFVQGQYVGELSLTECAKRNGVATDALDVGIDQSGALAAAQQAGPALVPLPPADEAQPPPEVDHSGVPDDTDPALPVAADDSCWRYGGARWRKISGDSDLDACVQTLYAGRCERPGGASYGRWGGQTLRLVEGRVEISDDNRNFRPLTPQAPDCSVAPIG